MDKRTLQALKASIKAWEAKLTAEDPYEISVGVSACPLCKLFHYSQNSRRNRLTTCLGCPVMAETGQSGCHRTPYGIADRALAFWSRDPEDEVFKAEWHKACQDEIDFLRSLLP